MTKYVGKPRDPSSKLSKLEAFMRLNPEGPSSKWRGYAKMLGVTKKSQNSYIYYLKLRILKEAHQNDS